MKRKILLSLLLFFVLTVSAAAQIGNIAGKVVTRVGRAPIQGAKVTLMTSPEMVTTSDAEGNFAFEAVPYGVYNVTFEAIEFMFTQVSVRVDVPRRDMDIITMSPDMAVVDVDDSAFVEFDMDVEGDGMSTPGMLSSSRDPFNSIAGYKFSSLRFRSRGYDTGLEDVYMNGIKLNDALNGYSPWSLWSGLNEATRNQESVSGAALSDFGIGGVNGVTNIDARASMLRQGFRASVVHASAQYAARVMLTYASGMQDNGWAYALSVSTRQGPNLLIDGVYYNAWGYYAAVEKQFNPMHRLSLTFLGTPTKRGTQMGATQEVYDLVGDNLYNPNWGWQDGKKRNARVRDYHEPIAILNYNWDISLDTKFSAAASFRFGKNGYSALDWYGANDPKPDYHRNLPSYYTATGDTYSQDYFKFLWENGTSMHHVDWQALYNTNWNSTDAWYDHNGNLITAGNRSKYIVSERHTDQLDFNINVNFSHRFKDNSMLRAGLNGRINRTEYYTSVKDLLGGDYWLNVDNFVERDKGYNWSLMPNDLRSMDDMVLGEGDKYGYDYYAHVRDVSVWASYEKSFRQFSGYLAGEVGYNTFWREGLYQKALFPDNSYGDSEKSDFFTYKAKLGLAYRPSGIHHVSLNAVAMAEAPYFQSSFTSPRTRNTLAADLTTVKTYGVDLNYNFRMPWLTFRVSGYYTKLNDMTKLVSFYDDTASAVEGATSTGGFSNMAIRGIDQRHYGVEFGFRVPVVGGFSISGAASIGDYTYTSDPYFTQTLDNNEAVLYENKRIIWDGYKVESTPQTAVNLSFNYRTESYWYFGIDFNYFDRMYLSMNPLTKSEVMYGYGLSEAEIAKFRKQEKFHQAIVANANVGKSWYIQRKYQLGFSFELKNFLSFIDNDTFGDIKTGGFEQMRIRAPKNDGDEYNTFDSKYFYLPGINYYLNIYFRF